MDLDALYKLTHGLYILGASDDCGRLVGSTVDAVMQVASQPVVIALSCNNNSYTGECIAHTGEFSLSVVGKKVDPFVIANFGYQSSREVAKWKQVEHYVKDGLPYLQNNLATLHCRVLHRLTFLSNTLLVAEVIEATDGLKDEPLTYGDYRTYFKTAVMDSFQKYLTAKKGNKMTENNNEKWVCTVCGYVYDGEVPFKDLPDDWVCPLCGVGKDMFELQ